MNTIRELIILDIINRLKTITISSPAEYDFEFSVNTLRAKKNIDPAIEEFVNVWPLVEESTPTKYGKNEIKMPVRIEAAALFGLADPSVVAEKLLGNIIKCLASPVWHRDPDYIDSIVYRGGGVEDYPEEGQIRIGVAMIFDITYTTAKGDPYAQ